MAQSLFQNWILAIRPKTLYAAICPVIIGTAMAFGDGIHHWPSALIALLCAVMIQIGTNLANDYFDHKKGADTPRRVGPIRVTQAGLISPKMVLTITILSFFISALGSLYLIERGGWPIALIAILSILSGILYTAGPWPLGYIGLGELFVLIFFGPVAVGGTYYVQSLEINTAVILAGFAPGLLSVAILSVNNLRDIEEDRQTGKKTLAVRFGRPFAMAEYFFSVIGACLIPIAVHVLTNNYTYSLLAVLTIFFSFPAFYIVLARKHGRSLNNTLAYTGKLLFLYTILFSVGWIM